MRKVTATRYVTPLREGGSLPAIVEADDEGMYVLKFRGAGQGPKALIAELLCGEIARLLGLRVPEIVLVDLDPDLARTEPDQEIQDLLQASAGLNLALDYLPGSITFDPLVEQVEAKLASSVVWLDAYISNVDRTARNTNMLMWHQQLWLIDHGAALYFHHGWTGDLEERSKAPFKIINKHALLPQASLLNEVDEQFRKLITPDAIHSLVQLIPDSWLLIGAPFETEQAHREAYGTYLLNRVASSRIFVEEAMHARAKHI